jgi:2-desacetyl-2-hydroxyethyl bacteriochlorophyllide A dehydrogenase
MLSITLHTPGEFRSIPATRPEPGPGEALVRIHRVGVCGTDLHAFAGRQPFFTYPRRLGHELGVEVIDPGDLPQGLHPGDRCAVEPYLNCGHCIACRRGKPNCCSALQVLGVHADGGMTSLLSIPSNKLHPSSKLNYDQLALVETLAIGAHAVERAAPTADDTILVIGAGPIGLSVLQFAANHSTRIAVLDTSERRLAFCRESLGLQNTIHSTGQSVPDALRAAFAGEMPTVVFDATGNAASMQAAFAYPAAGGKLVFVGLVQSDLSFNDPSFHRRELTLFATRNALPETFSSVIRLIEEGRIDTRPWITHRLPLAEVPERFPTIARDPLLLKAMIEVAPE